MRKELIKARNDKIIDAYKRLNMTSKELSSLYELSEPTIRKILISSKIRLSNTKNRDRNNNIKNDYWSGKYTQKELAVKYNLSETSIHLIIKEKKVVRTKK